MLDISLDKENTLRSWQAILQEAGFFVIWKKRPRLESILQIDEKSCHWEIRTMTVQNLGSQPFVRLVFWRNDGLLRNDGIFFPIKPRTVHLPDLLKHPWQFFCDDDWYAEGLLAFLEERLARAENFMEMFTDIMKYSVINWEEADDLVEIAGRKGFGEEAKRVAKNIQAARILL